MSVRDRRVLAPPVVPEPGAPSGGAASPPQDDPEKDLQAILRTARSRLNMYAGFIAEFTEGRREFLQIDCEQPVALLEAGHSDALEETYCHYIAEEQLSPIINNPADHPITANLPITRELGIGSYLSAPIRLRDGRVFGTFCCFKPDPDPALDARDLAVLEAFAELASVQIQKLLDRRAEQERLQSRIEKLTPRELEVLQAFGNGASNKAIALKLGLSPRTVEMHRARIFAKLKVDNLPQALILARDAGLIA